MDDKQSRRRPAGKGHRAFTLIELLVSMVVLILLGFLISTMVKSVSSVTKGSRDQV